MIKTGILNPAVQSLLCRVRHTNTLVIADRGLPYWPQLETIDLSLVDDVPTVLQVLRAVLENFHVGKAWMASEFKQENVKSEMTKVQAALAGIPLEFLPHLELKTRMPLAIGLIRTGDTVQYANMILESA